jgi:hypothetical protein
VAPFFISIGLLWLVAIGVIVRHGPGTLSHAPKATLPFELSRRIVGGRAEGGGA